jgi:hypothetical protein
MDKTKVINKNGCILLLGDKGSVGITYNDYGLFSKPSSKIEEFFEDDLEEQIENITFNINKFREYVK